MRRRAGSASSGVMTVRPCQERRNPYSAGATRARRKRPSESVTAAADQPASFPRGSPWTPIAATGRPSRSVTRPSTIARALAGSATVSRAGRGGVTHAREESAQRRAVQRLCAKIIGGGFYGRRSRRGEGASLYRERDVVGRRPGLRDPPPAGGRSLPSRGRLEETGRLRHRSEPGGADARRHRRMLHQHVGDLHQKAEPRPWGSGGPGLRGSRPRSRRRIQAAKSDDPRESAGGASRQPEGAGRENAVPRGEVLHHLEGRQGGDAGRGGGRRILDFRFWILD